MYKRHSIFLWTASGLAFIASYAFNLRYSVAVADQVTTVFVILFGFYITSISVLLSGNSLRYLYFKIDPRKDRRLTHTLRDYYSCGLHCLLIGVALFLIVSIFLAENEASIKEFSIKLSLANFICSLATASLILNILFVFVKTRLFLTIFINGMTATGTGGGEGCARSGSEGA